MFKCTSGLTILMVTILLVLSGCSSGHSSITPSLEPELSMPSAETGESDSKHSLIGNWTVNFDINTLTAKVVPDRENLYHFSVRPYLDPPAIMINSFDPVTQIVDVDVSIGNSFLISGYDVRLIIYTDNIGHVLTNSDSWTALFDIPGGWDINPFKAYAKAEPLRIFTGYTIHTENLLIYLPGGNPVVQFAIDASYPENCMEPYEITDFQHDPLYNELNHTANFSVSVSRWDEFTSVFVDFMCQEVMNTTLYELDTDDYQIYTGQIVNTESAGVGEYIAIVQAQTEFSPIYLYNVFPVTIAERPVNGWAVQIPEVNVAGVEVDSDGNIYSCAYKLWTDSVLRKHSIEGINLWTRYLGTEESYRTAKDIFVDTANDSIYISGSISCGSSTEEGLMLGKYLPNGQRDWAKSQCMSLQCYGSTIASDMYNNCYLTGTIYELHSADEGQIMRKYDENGDLVWVYSFYNNDGGLNFSDTAFDDSFYSYQAIGRCWGTEVDFDPTTGGYIREPYGDEDGFLTKWDLDGNLTRVVTWGEAGTGNARVYPYSVAIDSHNNTFITGTFNGMIDFDPNRSGILRQSYGGSWDIFLIKLDRFGNYTASLRLGCEAGYEAGNGLAIDEDSNVYITGYFGNTVDFDRSSSPAERTSAGMSDIFLAKYTNDLEYIWVQTWGSHAEDRGEDVAITPGTGNIVLMGTFKSTVDFDPGPGVFEMTAMNGGLDSDVFLMKLFPNGYWEP